MSSVNERGPTATSRQVERTAANTAATDARRPTSATDGFTPAGASQAATRPLVPSNLWERLKHPRRASRDRDVHTCLSSGGQFDAGLAQSFADLPKAEQREVAAWTAEEFRRGGLTHAAQAQVLGCLKEIPEHLRRGAWDLAHVDLPGPERSSVDVELLRRLAQLSQSDLAVLVRGIPRLNARATERPHTRAWMRCALELHTPVEQALAACVGAALTEPASFEAFAAADDSRLFELWNQPAIRAPLLAGNLDFATFAVDLRDAACCERPAQLRAWLQHKNEGTEETRAAMRALARDLQAQTAVRLEWAYQVPVHYRAAVARMLARWPRLRWSFLNSLTHDQRNIFLLAASVQSTEAACRSILEGWLLNLRGGKYAPANIVAQVDMLHQAGADHSAVGLWLASMV